MCQKNHNKSNNLRKLKMKNIIKNTIAILAVAITFASCSTSDETISGIGSLKIEFENGFAGNALVLGSATLPTSNSEVLKISNVKYIISNIELTNEDGTTFTYPKSESYFIVDEETPESLLLNLTNIPAGNYTKVKFGIGVDESQFSLGATGQGDLWTRAQAAGMTWSWASGYKFLAFEGTFSSATCTNVSYMIHTGKTGTNYNYTTSTLDLPTTALVRTTITPQIHLSTDLSQIIDGTNKINLSSKNGMGMGVMIMGGTDLPLITSNLTQMFSVEHVHNDPN
jgi:hypothetical protein